MAQSPINSHQFSFNAKRIDWGIELVDQPYGGGRGGNEMKSINWLNGVGPAPQRPQHSAKQHQINNHKSIQRHWFVCWLVCLRAYAGPPANLFHFSNYLLFWRRFSGPTKRRVAEWACRGVWRLGAPLVAFFSLCCFIIDFINHSPTAAKSNSAPFLCFDFMSWLVWFFFSFSSLGGAIGAAAPITHHKKGKENQTINSFNLSSLSSLPFNQWNWWMKGKRLKREVELEWLCCSWINWCCLAAFSSFCGALAAAHQ